MCSRAPGDFTADMDVFYSIWIFLHFTFRDPKGLQPFVGSAGMYREGGGGLRMSARERQSATPAEILVVDDIPANLKLLTSILADRGYLIRPASSGQLALRSLAVRLPDLILLDVKMPDMDGYEVCRRLKSDEMSRDIPVIFISALDETQDKVKGFDAGGVDFITKPFQWEEVLARIETHLSLRRLQKQLETQNAQLHRKISEHKQVEEQTERNEARLRSLVNILQYKCDSVQDFLDYALDEAIKLTESKIGYIYHYSEDRQEFILNSWSKGVMEECTIVQKQAVYQLEKTGL